MFITPAYAQAALHTVGTSSDMLTSIVPLGIALLFFFYWASFRPMEQQRKRQDLLIAGLKKGDQVVTTGGIIGTIVRVDDEEILLELGENMRVRILRSMVTGLHGAAPNVDAGPTMRDGLGAMGRVKNKAGG